MPIRRDVLRLAGAGLSALLLPLHPALAEIKGLDILAPSSPGSGYDQLARSIQGVLINEKLASGVQVTNVAGGGGTVGLAQFINNNKRGPAIMIAGFALVGGIITTKAPVSLDQLTPLARLMGEADILVVRADSPIKTMADLVAQLKANPASVRWAGGSIGGIDHVLTGLIAQASGADPSKVNFIVHAGGGEVLASILGGRTTVAVSGVEEFRSQIAAGKVRALAVSSETRVSGIDAPTLKEAGTNVAVTNWRGVLGHPELAEADRKAVADMVAAFAKSETWKRELERRGWDDAYLDASAFGAFLKQEQQRIGAALRDTGITK